MNKTSPRLPAATGRFALAAGLVATLAGALPAAAQAGDNAAATATATTATAPQEAKRLFSSAPVSAAQLSTSRAGSSSADSTITGTLQQTSATNVQGAPNTIRDGSFANALGLTTVIQNTGANVLIQNATTVNVQFKP